VEDMCVSVFRNEILLNVAQLHELLKRMYGSFAGKQGFLKENIGLF